jgi:ubiquinone/menaquinone biosynthesis C-methylase UbiE
MNHAASPQPSAADYVGQEIASLVPDKSNYGQSYLRNGRMFSFAHQVEEVLAFEPKRVLEVGAGPGIVTHALRSAGVEVLTLDVEPSLNPDLLGSVTAIPLPDASFDLVVCCQVLEHLPFDQFGTALREIHRVVSRGCVLSIPDMTRQYGFNLQIPKIGRHSFLVTAGPARSATGPTKKEQMRRDGHFWEIGLEHVTHRSIARAMLNAGWSIQRQWRSSELPWHHFYTLEA